MEEALHSQVHFPSAREWQGLLCSTFEAWNRDKALRLSAALAYYSVFSIAPLLVITIAMAGLFLDDEAASGQLFGAMKDYVGYRAAAAVEEMVRSAARPQAGMVATVVGFATLLIGASGVLGQLKDALNTVWEVEVRKGTGWRHLLFNRILSFGMVLVIGLLLLISLILSSWLAALSEQMQMVVALPAWVWSLVTGLASMLMVTALFAMLFKFLPDARVRWRDVWIGAWITAILFELGKTALGWYLGRESMTDAYGPAGAVVLLILWVYYASCILLFGAEFTQVYAAFLGRAIKPSAHAQRISRFVPSKEETLPICQEHLSDQVPHPPPPRDLVEPASAPRGPRHHVFRHRLLAPVLKYLEGRGLLLSIEAREALTEVISLLVAGVVCCVALFVAWMLLALGLVGLLTSQLEWHWLRAVLVAGAIHLVAALGAAGIIWYRATHGAWFEETLKELRKDRAWLKGN